MTCRHARRFSSLISSPGPRLLQRLPAGVQRSRAQRGVRRFGFELPLVSLVDCFLCLVLFLLASFSADATCPGRRHVPSADNAIDMLEAPVVAVTPGAIFVDGAPVGDSAAIVGDARLTRVQALFDALKSKRELWRQLNPGREFPGTVVLQVNREVSALVFKSAFQTAAFAGYPHVSLLVSKR